MSVNINFMHFNVLKVSGGVRRVVWCEGSSI